MPWISQVPIEAATGLLRKLYDEAIGRAGRVWRIVQIMSINPRTLQASMGMYGATMFGSSPLSRAQRELLATVVARELGCPY